MLRKDIKKPFVASLNPEEVTKFNAMADEWRNPEGLFKVIHAFHACRLAWLVPQLQWVLGRPDWTGLRLLDAGCATGLVSEEFAKRGASVTGIDVAERNIWIAQRCADNAGLQIDYRVAAPEELASDEAQSYDVVLALEVVEHVADVSSFVDALFGCVKHDGAVGIATLNRTWLAWLLGIFMAERVLHWLPKGTHAWSKFVKPTELDAMAQAHGFKCVARCGIGFNPFHWRWRVTSFLNVNYMVIYRRG